MGAKHTVELTREEAERRFVEAMLERDRRSYEATAAALIDSDLEHIIETYSDLKAGGKGFENYRIVR